MAISTSWLIGSTYVPETPIDIDGSPYVFPAGYYYLRHTTAARSLVDTLDGLLGDAGISGHTVYVAVDRKVRIATNPGWGFALTWPSALRSLFGFSANLPAADLNTASLISPLLWSTLVSRTIMI